MYEFEVKLINGKAWVYADFWTQNDGAYHFYTGTSVVMTYPASDVLEIKKTWPQVQHEA